MFCSRLRTRQHMKLDAITVGPQATAHYLQARQVAGPRSGRLPEVLVHMERNVNASLAIMYNVQRVQFYSDWVIGV